MEGQEAGDSAQDWALLRLPGSSADQGQRAMHFHRSLATADHKPNSCQAAPWALLPQLKDKWGFRMTARYDMYAEQLARYVKHDFKPQIIRDPSLE